MLFSTYVQIPDDKSRKNNNKIAGISVASALATMWCMNKKKGEKTHNNKKINNHLSEREIEEKYAILEIGVSARKCNKIIKNNIKMRQTTDIQLRSSNRMNEFATTDWTEWKCIYA